MEIRAIFRKARCSQIDWLLVGLAGAMAVLLVLSTTLMAWLASRSVHSIGRAAQSSEGLSGSAVSETPKVQGVQNEGLKDDAESQSEGIQQLPVGAYPEGDGPGIARALSPANGSAGYAGVPASPSRPELNGKLGNEIQPAKAESCEQGAKEAPTQLLLAKDPTEAAELAKKEHKLVFVLHVSGNFEESKFT